MAVSKTFPASRVREAYVAGLRLFGENRVQEFAGKAGSLGDLSEAEWHLIGHLQNNKASKAAELFAGIDSVDSLKVAERLNAAARKLDKTLAVLIEVNVGGEAEKTGVAEGPALEEMLEAAHSWEGLQVCGLMTIPPYTDDAQRARPFFRRLRQLRDNIAGRRIPGLTMDVLSMGMSHDFEVAIEEGATCIRLGTALFGERSG